jgi:hypothetical protein
LEAAAAALENEASEDRYNTFCIRALACVATLLQQRGVAERAAQLLREAPDEAFWAEAITNVDLPTKVPEALRQIDSLTALADQYPPYRKEDILRRIRSCAATDDHIARCLEGRFHEACAEAGSGLQLQEVGLTLAALGAFDGALSVARDPALEAFRRKGVLLVIVIEMFRHARISETHALLAELESSECGPWDRILLALGFGQREPWAGYPYPDW